MYISINLSKEKKEKEMAVRFRKDCTLIHGGRFNSIKLYGHG